MKDSVERRTAVQLALDKENIKFDFFDGVNIKKSNSDIVLKYDSGKTLKAKGYTLTDTELGCFASHIGLWKKCVSLNEPILILEDNFKINKRLLPFIEYGNKHIEKLGVLKFGASAYAKYIHIAEVTSNTALVKYKKGVCGGSSYMISPVAAKKYLIMSESFFEPVDNFMDKEWLTDQPLYTFHPHVISRSSCKSVIGNRKDKSKHSYFGKICAELYRNYLRFRHFVYNNNFNKNISQIRLELK